MLRLRELGITSRVFLLLAVTGFLLGTATFALAAPSGKQVVRVRLKEDLISLDPAFVGKPSDHVHAFSIYSGLVRLKAGSTEIEPDLATSWELSPDGKVYTFHLRRGVKFQKRFHHHRIQRRHADKRRQPDAAASANVGQRVIDAHR